jgi:RNA polymerase sigma-70 factor (ECF subfamily)
MEASLKGSAKVIHIEDVRLVRRVLRGDETAFRHIFDEYYDRLYRFALARSNADPHAAEDLVQQTMSRALQSLRSYRGEAQLQTWLFTICRNTIVDWQRKKGLQDKSVVLAEDFPNIRAVVESFSAPMADDPVARSENIELNGIVQMVLDRLPRNYGDALEWKYVQGWSILEISKELKIGQEATQSLLARAKRAFAEIYAGLGDDIPSNAK